MPNTIVKSQPRGYPVTRLSNGRLISQDPGLVNTPIYNAAANNGGLSLRVYDPASNTTHTIFNNGKTADFDRHGRLMDRAGVQNARNINQMSYEAATGTTPYSAPRPVSAAIRPSPPAPIPLRPALPQTRIRKDKTGFTIVTAPNGSVKYFDPKGNPSTAQAWGAAFRLHGQSFAGGPNPTIEVLKTGLGETRHQISKMWNGATDLAGQSIGNLGEYLGNGLLALQGRLTGNQNEVNAAREGQQKNRDALHDLASQMTPGTFKDIAQASGQASANDWEDAWKTASAIPGKNAQAFKDDPQQWAMNFASAVAPFGENLLAKSASMTRLAAGFRAMGQTERAATLEARAAALKAIGNGMTLKPVTEAAEGVLTKIGSKVPGGVGKFVERTAETNARTARLAERQAATQDLNNDLKRMKSAPIDPRDVSAAVAKHPPSDKPTTLVVQRSDIPSPSLRASRVASKPAYAATPQNTSGFKQFMNDVSAGEVANAKSTGSKVHQIQDVLAQAGIPSDEAAATAANGIFGPELTSILDHYSGGVNVQGIVPGKGVAVNGAGDVAVHPTHTIVVDGEPADVAPVVKSVGAIASPDSVDAHRVLIPGETLGPNDTKSTMVQVSIPSGVSPDVAVNVAKDLAGHPDLVDRNGAPLISNPTIIHDADGAAVIHGSSIDSQRQYGTSAADFATDFGDKSDEISRVLDSFGLPASLSIHPTVTTTMPIALETAPSIFDKPVPGENPYVQSSESNPTSNSNSDAGGSQSYSADSGGPAPQGSSGGDAVDPPTPLDKATSRYADRRVQQAQDDPQGFSETHGDAVDPPDDAPPDPDITSNDAPSTERAPADAGALSDSGQDANDDDGLKPSAKSKLDAAADAAQARLKAQLKSDRLYSSNAFIPSQELARMMADAMIVATRVIVDGATDYTEWQKQMLKEAGDWVEPHLQFIWDETRRKLNLHTNADATSNLGAHATLSNPELSTTSFSDSAFDPNEDASGHPNRSQTIAQGPDADELSPQESQSSLGNPDDVVADNSTGSDDTSAPPPTHTELVAKYFGVDPEKLLTSIHKRLEDRKTLVDIDDPDDVKLQNDIATYGAFDLAKGNGAKKINSRTWRQTLTHDINAADTKKYGILWKSSRDKYNLALKAEQFRRSGAAGNFPQNVTASQARAMPKDSRGLPLNPDRSVHFPALEKLKQEKSIGAAEQTPPVNYTEIPFRNSHLIQPGDASASRVHPWDIYHAVNRTLKNIGGEITGGMIGGVGYDRSIAGHQYIPIHNDEINVLRDEHGIVAPDAGPQYFATKSRNGRVAAAASRPGTSTALHMLMDKGGGTLGILIGGHGMSRGGLNYGRAYRAEVKYAIETGRLRQTDLDALTRHIASKQKGLLTIKGEDLSGKIHTFDDWYKIAPQFNFGVRNAFYEALGDPSLAKKIGAPTDQEVLGGFNGYHNVATGHVVSLVHVEPGQGKANSTPELNKIHGFDPPIAENIAYNYPSRGYGHGVLETPFPGLLLYHDALLKYAISHGERYTGTTKNMMNWIANGGGAHLTKVTPEMISRIENWIQHPYDVEKWTIEDAKRARTDIKLKRNQ